MDIEAYARYLPQYYVAEMPTTLQKYLDATKWKILLDCGCGDGPLLFALKKFGYFKHKKIMAIDLSKSRITLVKKIDPHVIATVDNAETLQTIKTASIDFLMSKHVIEHVDDKKMLATVARVLKKGGIAYIATVFKKWYGWYYHRKNGKWTMDVTHLREYGEDRELLDLIDMKKFFLIETKKELLYFPLVDFFVKRFFTQDREVFAKNPIFNLIRKIKVPIPGYYNWEIILRKR